jgi:midasin (ATPase involved in ribosome maturation)
MFVYTPTTTLNIFTLSLSANLPIHPHIFKNIEKLKESDEFPNKHVLDELLKFNTSLFDDSSFDIPSCNSTVLTRPILLIGASSSGKTTTIRELSRLFNTNLITLHLSEYDDEKEIVGNYVQSEEENGSFLWNDGILLSAIKKERNWILIENINFLSFDFFHL